MLWSRLREGVVHGDETAIQLERDGEPRFGR